MNHVLSARQFNPEQLNELFDRTELLEQATHDPQERRELAARHVGMIAATLFYEPSTRTRLSFESAAERFGMGVISTEAAGAFSSAAKGESLEDTIRVTDDYADIIILRHKESGAADKAAAVSEVPIINAGDGSGEHPTQTLLDLYTIKKEQGRLDNLHVVIGGDLKHGRTARSLAQGVSLFPENRITFVSVPELQMGDDVKEHLDTQGMPHTETDDMYEALRDADVVYWTRLQAERLEDASIGSSFVIDQAALQVLPDHATIMHPLPRLEEIHTTVDSDPRAAYFRQAGNGLYVRMALMDSLLDRQ